jgi:UPF0042 nucleotide-binding protein
VKLIIVSGLSGSGKSVALNTLEDLGHYCIDNLPASLLGALATELNLPDVSFDKVAVGIDARNLPKSLEAFGTILDQLHAQGIETEIIFLTSATETLIKRFSESRRRHPLSSDGLSLADAIDNEKRVLDTMAQRSDLSCVRGNRHITQFQRNGWPVAPAHFTQGDLVAGRVCNDGCDLFAVAVRVGQEDCQDSNQQQGEHNDCDEQANQ